MVGIDGASHGHQTFQPVGKDAVQDMGNQHFWNKRDLAHVGDVGRRGVPERIFDQQRIPARRGCEPLSATDESPAWWSRLVSVAGHGRLGVGGQRCEKGPAVDRRRSRTVGPSAARC